jgi:hypothetical protein
MLLRQLGEPNVQGMGNQVGDDGGARATLWQLVVVAGNLGNERCDLFIQREIV